MTIQNLTIQIGNAVKSSRKQSNISQIELAKILGIHQTALSRIETGKHSLPVSLLAMMPEQIRFGVTRFIDSICHETTGGIKA